MPSNRKHGVDALEWEMHLLYQPEGDYPNVPWGMVYRCPVCKMLSEKQYPYCPWCGEPLDPD